jgi:uncharacterized membrane protein
MMRAMDTINALLAHQPVVAIHLASALAAIALGAWLLAKRKGTPAHRGLGWAWVVAMGVATASSGFIRSDMVPALGGLSPIHLLTLLVLVQLPRGLWYIRTGNVEGHRRTMRGLYIGGCAVAGLFTLLPGRFLGQLLWKQGLGLVA